MSVLNTMLISMLLETYATRQTRSLRLFYLSHRLCLGNFNSALAMKFGGSDESTADKDLTTEPEYDIWSVASRKTAIEAEKCFALGMAQAEVAKALHGDTAGKTIVHTETDVGLEVVAVTMPDNDTEGYYKVQLPATGTDKALGKLFCKRWEMPELALQDLPPNYTAPEQLQDFPILR